MTKVLITLLTSNNLQCLNASYSSIKNQESKNIKYKIVIVVNTLNNDFYSLVKQKYCNETIIRTESNGKPGKGHNSLLNIFKTYEEYDYLIPIDGDDILYPCALQRIEIYLQYNPDVLMLPFTDLISTEYPEKVQHIGIKNKCYLRFNNNLNMRNQWYINKLSPFEYNINNTNTPARLFLLSRKGLNLNLYYDENMKWYDDFIVFLQIFEAYIIRKNYNIFMLDDKNIYLYNRLNETSVSEQFKINNEIKKKEEEKNFRKSIYNKYLTIRDWNIRLLPFLTSDVNLKFTIFNKVKFVENILENFELNNIEINKSEYVNFMEHSKINKFKEIESLYLKSL